MRFTITPQGQKRTNKKTKNNKNSDKADKSGGSHVENLCDKHGEDEQNGDQIIDEEEFQKAKEAKRHSMDESDTQIVQKLQEKEQKGIRKQQQKEMEQMTAEEEAKHKQLALLMVETESDSEEVQQVKPATSTKTKRATRDSRVKKGKGETKKCKG